MNDETVRKFEQLATVPRKPGEFAASVRINEVNFTAELKALLNTFCWDSALEMPDHILACQVTDILRALRRAHDDNVKWHNEPDPVPGERRAENGPPFTDNWTNRHNPLTQINKDGSL